MYDDGICLLSAKIEVFKKYHGKYPFFDKKIPDSCKIPLVTISVFVRGKGHDGVPELYVYLEKNLKKVEESFNKVSLEGMTTSKLPKEITAKKATETTTTTK